MMKTWPNTIGITWAVAWVSTTQTAHSKTLKILQEIGEVKEPHQG